MPSEPFVQRFVRSSCSAAARLYVYFFQFGLYCDSNGLKITFWSTGRPGEIVR
jgi:hypothetical protein